MTLLDPEFLSLSADLDVAQFRGENAECEAFTADKPRCALSFSPDDHWLFEFLLRDGSTEAITRRVRSDFEKADGNGGLIVTTAGSLAAGTGVGRTRWLMQVVAEECRYQ